MREYRNQEAFLTTKNKRPDKGKETEQTPTELRLEELLTKENDLKRRSVNVSDLYAKTNQRLSKQRSSARLEKMRTCGDVKVFATSSDLSSKRLLFASTCKDRMCPGCSKCQAVNDMKRALAVTKLMAGPYVDYVPLFLTLTIVNTSDLKQGLDQLAKGFENLMKRKAVADVVRGYIAKVEVTYNAMESTFHPHMHVLLFVDKSYFKGKGYIKGKSWLKMWREVTGDDRITQVRIERLAGRGKTGDLSDGIAEVTKYVAKSDDYTYSEDVFVEFVNGLRGRKLFRFGGECMDNLRAFENDKYGVFAQKTGMEQPLPEEFTQRLLMTWAGLEYGVQFADLRETEAEAIRKALEVKPVEEIAKDLARIEAEVAELKTKHKALLELKGEELKRLSESKAKERTSLKAKLRRLESKVVGLKRLETIRGWARRTKS